DRARPALAVQPLERAPALEPQIRHRPVDEIEIDVVEPEPLEARVERGERGVVAMVLVPQLRRDEYVLSRDAALADRAPDVRLVPVEGSGVHVAVARLERPEHRVAGLGPCRGPVDAEPEARDLDAVVQPEGATDREFHGPARSVLQGTPTPSPSCSAPVPPAPTPPFGASPESSGMRHATPCPRRRERCARCRQPSR